jgi:hypothetical protein
LAQCVWSNNCSGVSASIASSFISSLRSDVLSGRGSSKELGQFFQGKLLPIFPVFLLELLQQPLYRKVKINNIREIRNGFDDTEQLPDFFSGQPVNVINDDYYSSLLLFEYFFDSSLTCVHPFAAPKI